MLGKLKEAVADARLRAGVWMRERKEKAEERKTRAAMNSEHGHGRFFLLHIPAMATICAAVVEWYWAILFCIEATGRVDWNYETSFGTETAAASVWNFAFSTHWPVFVGLVCATIPIVMLSMVWLPVQFAMRGSGMWRRGTVIAVGVLANILVIVSGTVVMNYNRQDQVRESLVIEQSADAGRAAVDARLRLAREELAAITNPAITSYQAQAARDGAAAWARRVEIARRQNDAQFPAIERALVSAERADELRATIERLTIEQAVVAPTAATQAVVEDRVGAELNTFAQYVEVWRPAFIAVLCTLIGIFGAWWVLALMQGLNPRDVMRSGWADEGHRIEDLRDQPSVVPQPMKPPRETVTDAETGEELVKIKPREYWRKAKGKKQRVEITPEIPPDETGVAHDGGGRVGSVAPSEIADEPRQASEAPANSGERYGADETTIDAANGAAEEEAGNGATERDENIAQPESSLPQDELTDQERADLEALELAAADVADGADEQQNSDDQAARAEYANKQVSQDLVPDNYGEGQADEAEQSAEQGAAADDANQVADQPNTPITDERRMIAAE